MSEEEKKDKNSHSLSRRQFLIDAGLVVGGATVGSMGILSACSTAKTVTNTVTNNSTVTKTSTVTAPGGTAVTTVTVTSNPDTNTTAVGTVKSVNMTINAEAYTVQTSPEWSLQYVLHDVLGFMSIKDMCTGYGACGTCTTVVNGKPALTCMILAVECEGAVIETAEGLARSNHPLIQSYINYDCMQCGFCTPGFVTTAKALLDRNPSPTAADIKAALAGNLCRCGTYPQHVTAVLEAAAKVRGAK